MLSLIRRFRRNNEGATAIEYALIAALIAVAAITAMTTLGTQLKTTFGGIEKTLKEVKTTPGKG
jgi:pilus assembly protein Flp/PilA